MKRKKHTPEQIIKKLREADAMLAACHPLCVSGDVARRNSLGQLPFSTRITEGTYGTIRKSSQRNLSKASFT